MSVRVLYDPYANRAALYDSTAGVAFGPVLDDPDQGDAEQLAYAFLEYLEGIGHEDPRRLAPLTLQNVYGRWRRSATAREESHA